MPYRFIMRFAGAAFALSVLFGAAAQAQPDPLAPEPAAKTSTAAPPQAPEPDGTAPLTKENVDAWLDGFLPYAIKQGDIAGAVVSVVKDGKILTSKGYGYADLETRKPMDPAATLIRPGSVSKLFTWTAVMQLVEEGRIDLDADVNAYLDFKIPEKFGAPITVRNLMTHTAGFEEALRNLIVKEGENSPSLEEYIKSSQPARVFPPGTTPAYSNYGAALAGYIVQRVSGQSFDSYVEDHIFTPLGMTHSSFRQPLPDELKAMMSNGYKSASDGEAQYYEFIPAAPAGALASTANDMARFMIAHLNDGGPLLKPETAREMHTSADPHIPPLSSMALGFYHQNRYGARSIGHGGDTIFFHSDLSLFLDHDVGLFVSFNSSGKGASTLLAREAIAEDFAKRYFPEAAGPDEKTLPTAAKDGATVAGVYEASRASLTNFFALTRYLNQSKIAVDDKGELLVPFVGPTKWREVAPYVWRKVDGPERFAVKLKDGKVEMASFEPISPFEVLTPAPWYRNSALMNPLLAAAIAALGLTVLLWPAGAIVRWRYKKPFPLQGRDALAYRTIRIGAAVALLYLAGWAFVFVSVMADLTSITPTLDIKIRFMQIAQFALYAVFAAALWNAFLICTGPRSWFAKLWSVVLALSVGMLIWLAAIGGLLSFSLDY